MLFRGGGMLLFNVRPLVGALAAMAFLGTVAAAQAPHAYPFRATNYNVEVILHPENQTLTGEAKVDFVATEVSRTILVELHPDLVVSSVKTAAGKNLAFARDNSSPLLVNVDLGETATLGKPVAVTFDYAGPISNEDDSPTKGVRFGSIDKTGAYLLQPARWFPLTDFPSNRYTGTFKIVTPATFAVTGTGRAEAPTTTPGLGKDMPAQATYIFHCETPGPVGTFVAGSLQLTPVQTEGYDIPVFTPPAQAATANSYATSLAHILAYYSDTFGALSSGPPSVTIAQMPDGSVAGFSAPGLLLISARQWTTKANDGLLSRLAAGQWWGYHVLPATASDLWVTDGLSHYAEAMYEEQSDGISGLHRTLEEFAVGALMYEETTPIAQANHLGIYSDQYRSVVDDKGAMVFHMLRAELGDDNFTALLKDFFKKCDGKTATIDGFEKLAAQKVPPPVKGEPPINLVSFFSQWLNSTGVPEFKMEYTIYRTPKGFKVVGKIQQDLDTFRMPVEIKVDTEGNPETKKILVTGTSTEFEIDTFGRPKPNGITIDPNNNLLKSSPKLRVRASVARGEALAQNGRYYDAIQEYQKALDMAPTNSLAHFRMGEALFYEKNYQASANAFRASLGGDLDPKWVEVWSHIYIGKIYDLLGQRERAVNEYNLAQHLNDDTAGAQEEAALYIQKPYNGENTPPPAAGGPAKAPAAASAKEPSSDKPVLKRRPQDQ
jgi:aminopeptidase N